MRVFALLVLSLLSVESIACVQNFVPGSDTHYVLDKTISRSASSEMACYCDAGDEVISGGCTHPTNWRVISSKPVFRNDGRQGWYCRFWQVDRSARISVRTFCKSS